MKIAIASQKPLIMTAMIVTLAATFGLGLATRKGEVDPSAKFEAFNDSVLGLPCRIITSFRTLPERVNPTRSECN
jgi:hypothetical protein